MKQFIESIVGLRAKVNKILHWEISDSFNKIENNFYGPVNFINTQQKKVKNKNFKSLRLKSK